MGNLPTKQIRSTIWYVPELVVDNHFPSENISPMSDAVYVALSPYNSNKVDELSFQAGDKFVAITKTPTYWKVKDIHTDKIGDVPAIYLQELNELEKYDWYFGNMERPKAELLLLRMGKPGTFIVRESGQSVNDYSLSIRDKDSIKHYRIRKLPNGGFTLHKNLNFSDLPALVQHYKHTPGGLCSKLKFALDNTNLGSWEVPRNNIKLMNRLGSGHFARVFEGRWNDTIKVAVKVLKRTDEENTKKFLREAEIMKRIKHKNIVTIFAVCMTPEEESMYIVMELVPKGNLEKHLIAEGRKLRVEDLLSYAEQAAEGFDYLEKEGIAHLDIAARNLLVGDANTIKIADFGLSIFVNSYDSSNCNHANRKFPLQWTAPEVVNGGQFTSKSDVWSFGILLYEIFTKRAKEPYAGMSGEEAFEAVCHGYRLPKLPDIPDAIYKIMESCWKSDPNERPTFEWILWRLLESTFPDNCYQEIP